jgi:hypothetical protein
MFITNFEPGGNTLLEKNRTAMGNDSLSRQARYSERILTFVFLLATACIFSQVSTKCEN